MIRTMYLVLMLIFPQLAFSSTESGETITTRGDLNDDYYAAGGTIDIDAAVTGDVLAAGGELFIGHRVTGDVMAAGGSVRIRGEILDDVRTAGGTIEVNATIGDDLAASGGKINILSGTSVGGETWLAGGDVHMAGTVNKGLNIGAGNIRLSGTVNGDVELKGGQIQILESAIINGNLHYEGPNEASIHSAAKITGKVTYDQVEWDQHQGGAGVFFVITMIFASIVLFKLFPDFTIAAAGRVSSDPLKSLGAGFLFLIVTPVLAILLMSIILGLWVGLSILALYFVALLLGFLVACFFLGDLGAKLLRKDINTYWRRLLFVTLAIILLGLLKLIPVIGGLLVFTLLLLGLGANVLQLHHSYRQ